MYNPAMTMQYRSHNEIIELWKLVNSGRAVNRDSWYRLLALDIEAWLRSNGAPGIRITYYTVRRWHERNAVPIQYHVALVAVAKLRGFEGISSDVLSGIKCREHMEKSDAVAA